MTTNDQQFLIKILNQALIESEKAWNDKNKSHAWIVGYLEGTIKQTIKELEKQTGQNTSK